MKEKWHLVYTLARREIRDQLRDWRIMVPIIVLTLFFPLLMNAMAGQTSSFVTKYGADIVAERTIPFFVLVVGFFPITVSLVVALEAFVGEKERGTIEPLLSSPLEDWQLYIGKFISALFLPVAASLLDIFIYLMSLVLRHIALPSAWLLADTVLLTLVEAVVMVSGAIFISTQSTTVRGANLLASFIVIPMALLLQAEAVVLFWGTKSAFWMAIIALLILSLLLARLGLTHFQREHLLNRRLDTISPRKIVRDFWRYFAGGSRTPGAWYRHTWRTLRKMKLAILAVCLLGLFIAVVGFAAVVHIAHVSPKPATFDKETLSQISEFFASPDASLTFSFLFKHNMLSISAIMFFGFFSFSVLGVIFYLLNFGLLGAVLAAVHLAGYSPWKIFLYGILPHGIFELPAMILAGGVVFYAGVVLVTPQVDRNLSDILLQLAAETTQIFVGWIVPLLFMAALIEANITPNLLMGVF